MPDIPAFEPVYVPPRRRVANLAAQAVRTPAAIKSEARKEAIVSERSFPNDINRGLHASETRLEGKFPAARAH